VRLSRCVLCFLLFAGCAYEGGESGASEASLIETDQCEIFGIGAFADDPAECDCGELDEDDSEGFFSRACGTDFFAGRVRGGDIGASGSWVHLSTDAIVLASADHIFCRINGATLGDFGGPAVLNGEDGYTYRVHVQDFGDPSVMRFAPMESAAQTLSATRTYRPSRWTDGELDVTGDSARVTIPSSLPVTTGNAGNHAAWLTFQRAGTYDVVTCRYRGGASRSNPEDAADIAAGLTYEFERCTGERRTEAEAGTEEDVLWMSLHVQSGSNRFPSRDAAETTVSLDLDVVQLEELPVRRDFYRLQVFDNETGERVVLREGDVDVGDLTVRELR
jgi:hypothetical protein